jgi:predicted N-acyltransferase
MEYQLYTEFPAELENEWNELLDKSSSHVPFLRYEYLETWWNMRGGGEWQNECSLVIVIGRKNGKLAGIAPLFYTPDHQGKPCLLLLGSIEISDYLDLIATAEFMPEFTKGLLKFLQIADLPKWQALDLYNILENSPTLAALETAAISEGLLYQQAKLQHSPYISLHGDWEAYLAGIDKKQRHEIRRKMRRAENADTTIRWYVAEDAQTLDAEIDAFLDLMRQDEDKAKFLTGIPRGGRA